MANKIKIPFLGKVVAKSVMRGAYVGVSGNTSQLAKVRKQIEAHNAKLAADQRVAFAEEMPEFGPNAVIYSGVEAEDALDDLLENPADGEEAVTERLHRNKKLHP
jgi:hypothetical protein